MNRKLQKIVLVFILGFMQVISVSYANEEGHVVSGLEVKLSMSQGEYFAADVLMLNFTLTNTTSESITFLNWETPLENDFMGDMFTVKLEGQAIQYVGKLAKRAEPQEDDFITLAAGKSISGVLDLADGYAIENKGRYTLAFNKHLQVVDNDVIDSLSEVSFKSAQADSAVVGFMLNEERYMKPREKQANFSSCDASQESVLNDAHAAAIVIAEESLNTLNNTATSEQATAERYTTWFGSHTSSRYSTVTNHFTKIYDALADQQLTLHCGGSSCSSSTFAYVIVAQPYAVYLCNQFWNADLNGTDSKAGTLVHEVSHFTVVAETDDHAYTQSGAKQLAISNPDNAIDNADSHEYFAENTPELSMGSGTSSGSTSDSYEPNDSQGDAKTITLGSTQSYSLVPSTDVDWLKIVLTKETDIALAVSDTSVGEVLMSLYDSESVSVKRKTSQLTQAGLAAGTYFLKIEENGNDDEIAAFTVSLTDSNASSNSSSGGGEGGSFDQQLLYFLMLLAVFKISRKYWLK